MKRYWLNRLLWIFPSVFIIVVITFILSRLTPGDPILLYMDKGDRSLTDVPGLQGKADFKSRYLATARRYDLDLPVFYFSIVPSSHRAHLYDVEHFLTSKQARAMTTIYGSAQLVDEYLNQKLQFLSSVNDEQLTPIIKYQLSKLDTATQMDAMTSTLMHEEVITAFRDNNDYLALLQAQNQLSSHALKWYHLIPRIMWHGPDNQFHRWFKNILTGQWGISIIDGQSASSKIFSALTWSIPMNAVAWLIIIGLSILIGVKTAVQKVSTVLKILENILLAIYSMPLFWLASVAVINLTGRASWQIFPSPGSSRHLLATGLDQWWATIAFLALPIMVMVLNATASLSRQLKHMIISEISKPYIQAAWLRGIPRKTLMWRYALPNALAPMTVYISGIIPALISGSVVIENIFNIPGIGKLVVSAIYARDWQVAFLAFMMAAILSVISIVLADYALSRLSPISARTLNRLE